MGPNVPTKFMRYDQNPPEMGEGVEWVQKSPNGVKRPRTF